MRVFWLLDECSVTTEYSKGLQMRECFEKIISLIKRTEQEYIVLNPWACLEQLASIICELKPTLILDLMGLKGSELEKAAPDELREFLLNFPTVTSFRISRLHEVRPKLKTAGYLCSMSREEISSLRHRLDCSHPLIIDNVGMSGRTILKVMEWWGFASANTMVAFLLGNTGGRFGKPGALQVLHEKGVLVGCGHLLHTPEDDAWHLTDLLVREPDDLEIALEAAQLQFHGVDRATQEFLNSQGKRLVREFFSWETALASKRIEFMGARKTPTAFGVNPVLWTFPHFYESVDFNSVVENKVEIAELLTKISDLE